MSYLIEKKKRRPALSFDQSFKLNRQSDDKLKARADRKDKARKPVSTLDRIRAQKKLQGGGGTPRLHMTTPKAKDMEKKFHGAKNYREGFIFVSDLMSLHEEGSETSELEKRCIVDVMGKASKTNRGGARSKLSRAYAICRASLQKSGRIEQGGMELTKKGGKISGKKAKRKDHDDKVSKFEKHVVAARKK